MWLITILIVLVIVGTLVFFLVRTRKKEAEYLAKIRCPNCNKMVMPPRISLPEGFDAGMQEFSCPECGASVVIPMI
ncbi:hypothetical protein KA005_47245 [bacterium]|nr:hypothetical protein [bacterium]